MKYTYSSPTLAPTSVIQAVNSDALDVGNPCDGAAIASVITVDTNAAGIFAASSLAANAVTVTAHGWKTGVIGQVTTAGVLPTGLVAVTNYYIIVIDANTVKFASSLANAIAGTAIALSGGTGNSTFTPTALAGATVQAFWSRDNINWIGIGSATSIAAATNFGVTVDRPQYRWIRLQFALTSGSLTVATTADLNKEI